jgi:DNA-cytosine methyltransferase
MNVLSLFDGMSCGQQALNRLGIKYDNYYASELDKYAIQITQKNFPDTIQLGDVCGVVAKDLPKDIDLLLAGSPCQGFSFAGKQLAFDDPRSALFFEFIRLLRELKPKYFLLENVRMKKEYLDVITEQVGGIEPILINSALLSAQNRQRYYWTNIPGVTQPEDKGLVLSDVLEDGYVSERDKSYCLDANYFKGTNLKGYLTKKRRQLVVKSMTEVRTPEANKIRREHIKKTGKDWSPRHMRHLVERDDEKSNTITASMSKQHIIQVTRDTDQDVHWRKLTPLECERLQTVDDNYTEGVSNTQRYKMLGNGWTIDVISHILNHIK